LKRPKRTFMLNTKRCPVLIWTPFLMAAKSGEIFKKNNAKVTRVSKAKMLYKF